ncbi:PucR family transcriptional regulator [Tsukamurella paurometabola]|uniref:Helix-turn-helix domain-containing protein n=1 Tax=Tsukamurella paurometabola TaxID=2061 RepID=A0A3P8MCB4_TSUPA|nr:helix-turn-helix domain-containing protein [Tsukamurella paurometabola]MBS4104186.1 helix-turn-helix domain-containing protein [Tsukamurella paurometabola]UEA85059.1 helix-turn-helix domain-containing protein [Tsukamurella paurometabola]VDR37663.1 Sugar diacid utilization regulator [Tsukamurella paurometabola]
MSVESIEPTERTKDLYDELFARVLAGAGTTEIVDAVVEACPAITQILVVDDADCEVARSPLTSTLDPRRDRWVLDVVTQGRRLGRPIVVPRREGRAIYHPAAVAGRYVGGLLVVVPLDIDDAFVTVVGRFAGLYALLAARDLELMRPGVGIDLPVVRDLLVHRGVLGADLRVRSERAGLDLTAEWVVSVIGPSARVDLRGMCDAVTAGFGYVAVVGGAVAVLVAGDDPAGAAADIGAEIQRALGTDALVCAASAEDVLSGGMARAYSAAATAARVLRTIGRSSGAVDAASLPAFVPLLKSVTSSEMDGFLDSMLGPIREFDDATSSELLRTLRVFFDEKMNTAATARRLGLHPNTVIKRQRRLTELLGGGWADGAGAVSLRLALSIDRLAADQRD